MAAETEADRARLLHLLRQRGIVEVNGVPVEEFVRVQEVL